MRPIFSMAAHAFIHAWSPMPTDLHDDLSARMASLETSVRRLRAVAGGLAALLAVTVMAGFSGQGIADELRTHRLVVVDDSGRARVVLGQDRPGADRRSRSAGLLVFDRTGTERGGFVTMDDGGVVLALDAPAGVGAPMRDRLGLMVGPDGSSHVMLLDNGTRAVAKLDSDGKGGGGVQVFSWDTVRNRVRIRTLGYHADTRDSVDLGK